jgi:hypothetical protein
MSSRLKVIESDTSPNWYGLNSRDLLVGMEIGSSSMTRTARCSPGKRAALYVLSAEGKTGTGVLRLARRGGDRHQVGGRGDWNADRAD